MVSLAYLVDFQQQHPRVCKECNAKTENQHSTEHDYYWCPNCVHYVLITFKRKGE